METQNHVGQNCPPPAPTEDMTSPNSMLFRLLSQTVERQIEASHETAKRVEVLGDRVETSIAGMGQAISTEIRSGMARQNTTMMVVLVLAIVILGGAAGVTFFGERMADGSLTVRTGNPSQSQPVN